MRLANGDNVPASSLRGDWIDEMREEGILSVVAHGSRRSYRCYDRQQFRDYIAGKYDIRDLEASAVLLNGGDDSRSRQVKVTGDSKVVRHRVMKGFLINSYEPIAATINGKAIQVLPADGTYLFVYDYENFMVEPDVLIVGMENSENFRYVKRQKWLFDSMFPGRKILFVSRYPQNESRDLVRWLESVDNEYVHFGDLDLAGVHIFLTEFYRYLGNRSSFLIPPDYEKRIKLGSRERYDAQLSTTKNMVITDQRLQPLVDCIHRLHRGYDQEGFLDD